MTISQTAEATAASTSLTTSAEHFYAQRLIVRCLACESHGRGIKLMFIQPGNPQQNAYIERFNRTMRYELLSPNLFGNIE